MQQNQDFDALISSHHTYADERLVREVFAKLRAEDPVHWTQPPGYAPFWTVTRHADVIDVGRRNDVFQSEPITFMTSDKELGLMRAENGDKHPTRVLLHMNGDELRAYGSITQSWFLPASLRRIEDIIEAKAVELLDDMERRGGECDFAMDIAVWFPLRVVMSLLGIPASEHSRLLTLTQRFVAPADPTLQSKSDDGKPSYRGETIKEFMRYFDEIFDDRRANPQSDLATIIANATIGSELIGRREATSYYMILAIAGHDTTASSISGGLLALLENPEQLAALRENPALMPTAVEEVFRWVTPVKHFMRTAVADTTVGGVPISAGQRLMLSYPSANQDSTAFEQPEAFRVARTPNKHVAFGFGAHACIGQSLARLEMRVFMKHLLARFGEIRLAGTPQSIHTNQVGGLKYLPVRYSR